MHVCVDSTVSGWRGPCHCGSPLTKTFLGMVPLGLGLQQGMGGPRQGGRAGRGGMQWARVCDLELWALAWVVTGTGTQWASWQPVCLVRGVTSRSL